MEWLNSIDIDLFKLINSSGFNEVDYFIYSILVKLVGSFVLLRSSLLVVLYVL